MARYSALIPIVVLISGGLLFASVSVQASPALITTATPTFDVTHLPTANSFSTCPGRQRRSNLLGYVQACHGDHGQGLTEEWRSSFASDQRDCWQSGCHGSDFPEK